jgi:hypothetical protein
LGLALYCVLQRKQRATEGSFFFTPQVEKKED